LADSRLTIPANPHVLLMQSAVCSQPPQWPQPGRLVAGLDLGQRAEDGCLTA
jgi:hypothetical protein